MYAVLNFELKKHILGGDHGSFRVTRGETVKIFEDISHERKWMDVIVYVMKEHHIYSDIY